MSKTKRTALVVAPGRGVYNAAELGYFHRHHESRLNLLAGFDAQRAERGGGLNKVSTRRCHWQALI